MRKNSDNSVTRHHRKPKSIGGNDDLKNISIVQRKRHEAWHLLFSNMTASQIAFEINSVWIDPDYCLILTKKT